MAKTMRTGLGLAMVGLGVAARLAAGQVVEEERDTTVTGPRGRTIQRDVKVERGPGFVDRQVEIKRPGETIIRDTRMQTRPGGGGGRGFAPNFGGPRFYGGPRFVENVIVQRPPVVSTFIGLPALSFGFGGVGAAFGGGGGGGFGGGGGAAGGPAPAPQPAPGFDAFADAMGRLKSFHASSRMDGALTLGRIGDPRAIPALNERLEHDFDKEVRVAAAQALGEIGDERGAVALEKASIHDKRNDVREAAKLALTRIPKPVELPPQAVPPVPTMPASAGPRVPPPIPSQARPLVTRPGQAPSQNVPVDPAAEDIPPPPPVPAPLNRPMVDPSPDPGAPGNPS